MTTKAESPPGKATRPLSRDGQRLLYGETDPATLKEAIWTLPMTGDRRPALYLPPTADRRGGPACRGQEITRDRLLGPGEIDQAAGEDQQERSQEVAHAAGDSCVHQPSHGTGLLIRP